MKKLVRKLLTNICAVSPEQVIPAIERVDCKAISFDIFDTLLKRNVSAPADVFLLLEKQYQCKFGSDTRISALRSEAERRAVQQTGRRDVNFREIYQVIEGISEAEREWLMEEEIHIEQTVCQRWQPMGQVYDWCLNHGIPVFLISDMYLPKEVITGLLHAAGYKGWKRLYISAQEQANKADGRLFDVVMEKERLKPGEWIHIGDSLRGDYLNPKRRGLQSVLIKGNAKQQFLNKKELKRENQQGELSYCVVDALNKNNIDKYENFYQKIGYGVVGPILYGYSKWLLDRVQEEKIDKIFFLAREGYFLKRGFDILNRKNIKNEVIQVSRKSTAVPRLYKADDIDQMIQIIKFERAEFTIKKLLDFCEVDSKYIQTFLMENNLELEDILSKQTDEKKKALFQYMKPLIDRYSHEQERNIKGYFAQAGFEGKIAVSDVGWLGTIQNALQDIFPESAITGYYIGKYEKPDWPKVNSQAYLFDGRTNHHIYETIMGTKDLFELFFLSTEGSASHYEQDGMGRFSCRTFMPEQTEASAKHIKDLQDAACEFVSDLAQIDEELHIDMTPEVSFAGYQIFITHIKSDTIRELRQFSFLNVAQHSLMAERGLSWYVFRPQIFIREFMNNGCKALYLKSVFRVPFPYIQLVDFMQRIFAYWKEHRKN